VHRSADKGLLLLVLLVFRTDSARLLGTGKNTSCRCVEGKVTPTSGQLSTLTSRRFSECPLATAFICPLAIYRTSPTQNDQQANISLARSARAQKDERNSPTMQPRRLLTVGGTAAIVLTLAACGSHTTTGTPVQAPKSSDAAGAPTGQSARPPAPPKPVPASSISKLVLSTDEVDDIVGLTLNDRMEFPNPGLAANDTDHPDCTLATGLTKEALGNGEFTGFRQVRNQATKDNNLVGLFRQNIAIFETAAKATELFHKAYGSLGKCNSTTITAQSNPTAWKIVAPGPFNGDTVTLHELQLTDKQQVLGWRCDHEARVKNNVILEASQCAWANGGPSVTAGLNQISARIPPPDKPAAPSPPNFLTPNKIKSIILGVQQVSNILGSNLGDSMSFPYPPDPRDLGDKSQCSPLIGPDVNSFGVNVDYTAFREAQYREDKDDYQHIINQQVATYPDAQTASRTFQNAFQGLAGCDGALVPMGGPGEQFQLQAPVVNGDTAEWASIDLVNGQPSTWRCIVNFRTQSNVLFTAKVCQYGNAADLVKQIADEMANSLPK
jgi:hypothetical protein